MRAGDGDPVFFFPFLQPGCPRARGRWDIETNKCQANTRVPACAREMGVREGGWQQITKGARVRAGDGRTTWLSSSVMPGCPRARGRWEEVRL